MYISLLQFKLLAEETLEKSHSPQLQIPPQIIWVFAIVVGAYIIVRITMRRVMRHQKKFEIPLSQRLEEHRASLATQDQMHELMAALADLSRQINGQIDTRLAKLEVLMSQAESVIKRLEQTSGSRAPGSETAAQPSFDATVGDVKEITRKIQDAEASQSSNEATEEIEAVPDNANSSAELSPQAKQVLELARKGLTPMAIAKELSRPVGEIELILSLAGKK